MTEQRKNLRKYIVPAMIGNLSFFILTIVDGMFVGNGVGSNALGAVSLAMPFICVVYRDRIRGHLHDHRHGAAESIRKKRSRTPSIMQ